MSGVPSDAGIARREVASSLLCSITGVLLLRTIMMRDLLAAPAHDVARQWLDDLVAACADLRVDRLTAVQWQAATESLFNRIALEEMLSFIEFDRLKEGFSYPDDRAGTREVTFPGIEDIPRKLGIISKILGLKQGTAIIPHGHRNMVSCHLVIGGRFELRHYDRVDEDAASMVIRPTIERISGPGDPSSISDLRNNVHWFRAISPTAFTFDVILVSLDAGARRAYSIDFIDPDAAAPMENGLLRAPKLGFDEAIRKYGRRLHDPVGERIPPGGREQGASR